MAEEQRRGRKSRTFVEPMSDAERIAARARLAAREHAVQFALDGPDREIADEHRVRRRDED